MSSKKYELKLIQVDAEGASTWTAQVVRRVTTRKQMVSKEQAGFATEAEALAWAQESLQTFLALQKSKQKKSAD